MPKFGVLLAKTLSYDSSVKLCFYLKHCRVMVIRRGDVTDIVRVFARLEMKCLTTNQRETALIMSPSNHSLVYWQATNQIWASVALALGNYP